MQTTRSTCVSFYLFVGVGLFYNFLSQCKCELLDRKIRENGVVCTEKLLNRCLRHIDLKKLSKNISVYTSPIGPLCLGALSSIKHGSENTEAKKFVEDILSASKYGLDVDCGMPDEALYGRTGYLNCLITLRENNFDIPVSVVSSVCVCVFVTAFEVFINELFVLDCAEVNYWRSEWKGLLLQCCSR